ncbi:RBBP8 N-terminal-like protein [Nannospalax galili]|uniref:RBBP8 N-terminal-like protein n=1 Tax=Nannospalax galili TaxID=1026970 RepID=UPI00111BFC70|nr:RBBP8 N-terminal-like protein [Nannospalax galili]
MDNFMESLNRLKEAHEKEVLGLQNKLLELNSERCRDAQRVEELFAKNHQLREQQKALKENLRVLENRLRAGLCDRCMVTQELARKKRLELESTHLQSLQHLCVLTNEMNGLKEENKILKEEVKRLRSLGDKSAPQAQEGTSEPPSPLLLTSPGGWKGTPENLPGGPEEAEEDEPSTAPQREEKPASHKTSPVARISPAANMPEPRTLDMSPQCISNQLHSTVAVVRPGSRACPPDCGSANGTPPPPSTRSSPLSLTYEHGLPLDSFLRASRPSAMAYEALKRSLQADRLCLLNPHPSLRQRSPHSSPPTPAAAAHSPRSQSLKAGEAAAWEEPTGLPGTLVGIQDPRLEGALQLLLAQQQLRAWARAGTARPRGLSTPEVMPSSPRASSDSESSEKEAPGTTPSTAAQPGEPHPPPTGPGGGRRKETRVATQDCPPDKPLDLSDRGRCWDAPKSTGKPLSPSPTVVHTPSPQPPALSRLLTRSPWALSNGTKKTGVQEPEEPCASKVRGPACTHRLCSSTSGRQPTFLGLPSSLCPTKGRATWLPWPHASLPSWTAGEAGGRSKPAPHLHRPNTDGLPEPSKAEVQRPEMDELEEPDTSDSEVDLRSEASVEPSMLGEEHQQGLQQKRKWASDTENKDPKKPSQGRRKLKEPLTAAEGPRSPRDTEDGSMSPATAVGDLAH